MFAAPSQNKNKNKKSSAVIVAGAVFVFAVSICLFSFAKPARADIQWSDDIHPYPPPFWDISTRAYIGKTAAGSVTVTGGSELFSKDSYLGYESGAAGTVTVNGIDSKWTNRGRLYVGRYGSGTLDISGGGEVVNASGYIGYESGSMGTVVVNGIDSKWTNDGHLHVGRWGSGTLDITGGGEVTVGHNTWLGDGQLSSGTINFNNGTLTTGSLLCSRHDLHGTGVINTHGLISDVDLIFNATYGSNQILHLADTPGKNITINLSVDGTGTMGAGYGGVGSMSISAGRYIASTVGFIGYKSDSVGAVNVNGVGSTWTNSSTLFVGQYGSGVLDITGGGAVSNHSGYIGYESGSTGQVTVDGSGTMWTNSDYLYVGHDGSGRLNITDGGVVNGDSCYIGYGSSSMGKVTVDGPGSTWNGGFCVGYHGCGTLDITNGGTVSSPSGGNIGYFYGSMGGQVTVNGTGSTWTMISDLCVGRHGSGRLDITGGGAVSNRRGNIGFSSNSTGAVTVDGAGSTWTNSEYLGVGNGTLDISGGGLVSSWNSGISGDSSSPGAVRVDGFGSMWTTGYDFNIYYGTLDITGGGLVGVGGNLATNSRESFINLDTGGMLALYGNADGSLGEFLGLIDCTDAIRYWDDSISDWADINEATYGEDYTLGYLVGGCLDGYTLLCVGASEPGIPGDANGDGAVNADDAATLARYWLTREGAVWGMGDFNRDGAVNDIDAALLAANWNIDANASVPEPSVIVGFSGLALAGFTIVVRRRYAAHSGASLR